jgi:hypothetical protein
MPRKPRTRIVRAIADRLAERDRREMKAVDSLLSLIPQAKPPRRRHRHQTLAGKAR